MSNVYREKARTFLKINSNLMKSRYEAMGKRVIAVLGSFDTWPYIDYICRILARLGHFSITSLYVYFSENGILQREERGRYFKDLAMRESLRFMIFEECHEAIITYSLPGAHYIETEWCFNRVNEDPNFKYYGIAFVRKIANEDKCPFLKRVEGINSTECTAKFDRTAWDCIETKEFCPFKEQGVAKNVFEYFFANKRTRLFSVECLEDVPLLLNTLFH